MERTRGRKHALHSRVPGKENGRYKDPEAGENLWGIPGTERATVSKMQRAR